MPELPEVEDAARRIRAVIVGRTLVRISLHHAAYRRRLSRTRARIAEGKRVLAVERRGKHQLIRLEGDVTVLVHFRMTGDWEIGLSSAPLDRFARAQLLFDDGLRVTFVDSRALGTLTVHRGHDGLPAFGMEPLEDGFTPQTLRVALARRRIPIKVALLDQDVVAGVGNIYAAEALWRARIDPRLPADMLDAAALRRLVRAIRLTLTNALRAPARYAQASDVRFKVYDREGKPCPRCRTAIQRITQSQRSTYFCSQCQGAVILRIR